MKTIHQRFTPHPDLHTAVEYLNKTHLETTSLPDTLPLSGIGETQTLELLAPHILGKATHLDAPFALAHMDPPTPWITWAIALWNARLNQNLLHPATSPFAKGAEERVIEWLSPLFGMSGGHFCAGSTLANLTALWAARECAGVMEVVASEAAHISIPKAAHLLGLNYRPIPVCKDGTLDASSLGDLSKSALVLTEGTTTLGALDTLTLCGKAAWTHVDAAWAGALRLSPMYASLLEGIEYADSIAISTHKWFFQPKDSAIIFFKDSEKAHKAISFGSSYLATPNVGIQGSRCASAVLLLATLLAWGKEGLADCIEHTMQSAHKLAQFLQAESRIETLATGQTGINVFRPLHIGTQELFDKLPIGMFSTCTVFNQHWIRSVSANPLADTQIIIKTLTIALE
ncbi:pyridoxal phosphate-dependent decarboxylase family protein [Sulfurospirillum sp.]|uniref:pyridoxal phosphate-dependent decarboxylase family protein n=1 Tax=Sulfurospirillum sp. TaxID=2053622 RepID=UPI002FDEFA34